MNLKLVKKICMYIKYSYLIILLQNNKVNTIPSFCSWNTFKDIYQFCWVFLLPKFVDNLDNFVLHLVII